MSVQMIDVSEKKVTKRVAVAAGNISMLPDTLEKISAGLMPKGDVLTASKLAGIIAAKRTSESLPLCHPISLSSVDVSFEIDLAKGLIHCRCTATTLAQTGVEMEALTGCTTALLCVYDMTKGINPDLTLSEIKLIEKQGGKSGHWRRFSETEIQTTSVKHSGTSFEQLRAAIIISSDRASSGFYDDKCGPLVRKELVKRGAEVVSCIVVPDEIESIRKAVGTTLSLERVDFLILSGGTGIGPRDVTPEALLALFTKSMPGVGELLRNSGSKHTANAWLSRSVGGLISNTFVVALPGNPAAIEQSMDALESIIPHAIKMIAGGRH